MPDMDYLGSRLLVFSQGYRFVTNGNPLGHIALSFRLKT